MDVVPVYVDIHMCVHDGMKMYFHEVVPITKSFVVKEMEV